ncbi:hypothetical protein HN51_035727 [Arachis hypogaea]|uniref:protein IQ-DOMAIN 14 n=1 Tax=Arachis ipaensis TaxID=130454 RepID=UPI0007AF7E01|nr:protein IQ-DOMAIN 14 [Arachis ipaensis]XP_020974330.1 protein IQ-DOMAIN 14 [Arachis ipaensis]XP_025644034.1 protein IQ-DOMAIN 14 [Arachis hypogaea]QHO00914.1 Protein IQ-DOMAIN [Arachis hypogaea]QHO00915.1 Protein IQ-DOMAIN [Arachis hypogaea]
MGRATRWFKSLFGIKRDKERSHNSNSTTKLWGSSHSRSDSGVLCHNPATIPPNISPAEAAWLESFYSKTEREQNKHAIAVAAATAAAADAAVAAAQAAVAVVRLTSHGRDSLFGGHEKFAAVKIQTVFRGFLARKALRALKGLVKIQAIVRGYLVRKQAAETLHGMQALVRAQAAILSHKYGRGLRHIRNDAYWLPTQARRSLERFDETRTEYRGPSESRRLSSSFDATMNSSYDGSPKIVEVDTGRPKSRSRRTNISMSDFGDDPLFSSPLPVPCRDWGLTGEEGRLWTAQSTPRLNSCSCGVFIDSSLLKGQQAPNYMANTESFKAKKRSQSAPRQRGEASPSPRNSLSGVGMSKIHLKNAVMAKLEMSAEFCNPHKMRHT